MIKGARIRVHQVPYVIFMLVFWNSSAASAAALVGAATPSTCSKELSSSSPADSTRNVEKSKDKPTKPNCSFSGEKSTTADKTANSEAAATSAVDVVAIATRKTASNPTGHGPKTSTKIGEKKLSLVRKLAIAKMQRLDSSPVEIIPGK